MSSAFFVYGEDSESEEGKRKIRLLTPDFAEALQEFTKIVQNEESGSLEWSS